MSNILTNNINPRSGNVINIGGVNDTVSIAGTVTYEDVTSVDSIGVVTARSGLNVVGGGITAVGVITSYSGIHVGAGVSAVGIITAQSGVEFGTVGSGVTISAVGAGTSLGFLVNGSERVRIDSSGRLLIGTSAALDTSAGRQLQVANTNGAFLLLGRDDTTVGDGPNLGGIHFYGNDTTSNAWTKLGAIDCSSDGIQGAGDNPTKLVFSTTADGASSPTERMRIDNSGIVYIRRPNGAAGSYHQMDGSSNYRIGNASGGSGNYVYLVPGGTSWAGTSDERLKTGLVEIQDGLSKVSTLRAVTGRYTTDPETESRSFLIAQDVAAVLPEAVDAADSEKLGLRYTDTIPLLVAALKESKERIETLETRLTALEGN